MRVLILLALLGAAVALVPVSPKRGQRIVGGSVTTIEEYPYMTNLQLEVWGILWWQICGGSLITNVHILTAAHCAESGPASSYRAILGSSFANGAGGDIHLISNLKLHEKYDEPVLSNDIAVLRLFTPAIFSDKIQQVAIAGRSYPLPDFLEVHAIGWGALIQGGPSPDQLHHVDMEVINQELCAERYAYLKTLPGFGGWPDVSDGMICSGALDVGGKDACQGDSGGPVVHQNTQVGIVSWGYGCAHHFYPGVSARVPYYSDWIVTNAV